MKRLFACTFLLASVWSASAQSADSVLTFQRAVKIALQNNATLNTQKNNLFQSRVNKTYRFAQLGPTAGINGSLTRGNGNAFIPQEGRVVNATVYGASASLTINQPIFNGLTGFNTARSASELFDAQLEGVNRSNQDVINTVAIQYLQVLLDQELLKIAQENVVLQQATMQQVKAQVELGSRSPVDEYNQQAQLSNAELRVAQAELALTNDRLLLYQSLMIDPNPAQKISEPAWDLNAIAMDNLSLDDMVNTAMEKRSDLKQARHLERGAKYSMSANFGGYLPSLNAFYRTGSAYNQLKDADKADPTYRNFDDQIFTDNKFNTFGLSINIPVFNSFQNRFFYVQSKVTYQNSKLVTRGREVAVKSDVMRAYENLESVKKAYQAGLNGLEASTQAMNLERERYQLGVTTFVDFANANRTYVQAQTDMAQAKYRFLFQKIMVDYALGTLKVDDLPN